MLWLFLVTLFYMGDIKGSTELTRNEAKLACLWKGTRNSLSYNHFLDPLKWSLQSDSLGFTPISLKATGKTWEDNVPLLGMRKGWLDTSQVCHYDLAKKKSEDKVKNTSRLMQILSWWKEKGDHRRILWGGDMNV